MSQQRAAEANSLIRWMKGYENREKKVSSQILDRLQVLINVAARKKCLGPFLSALETAEHELGNNFRLYDLDTLTAEETVKLFGETKEEMMPLTYPKKPAKPKRKRP